MNIQERLTSWLRFFFFLSRNTLSMIGVVLVSSTSVTLIFFWVAESLTHRTLPAYVGILFFLVLPGLFVIGLLLIPTGMFLFRHKLRAEGHLPESYPQIDLGDRLVRRSVNIVVSLSFVNIFIFGTASYKGVEYMETTQFCGQACHVVMDPEFTAYQNSPHQRVACVQCHIGPGADWFVRSKLSGTRQVFAVMFNTFPRPIPSPVHNLRPARETCEQCHWPEKFSGDKFLVRTKYTDDEKNTPQTTVLVLKLGGITWQGRVGIHGRHLDVNPRISYISTDARRQVIPKVIYRDDDGKTIEFESGDVQPKPEELAKGEHRVMDCVDCHNRPTHAFDLPERAVDKAMSTGLISTDLPFMKKKAVEVLRTEYPDRETGRQRIAASLTEFYKTSYPQVYQQHRAVVERSVENVQKIYMRNVFPNMKITWGTHPNNIGHEDFLGCFRCHDGSHTSKDGRVIKNDCDTCHTILAMGEEKPKILQDLGMK
jgi:hypothetical protein